MKKIILSLSAAVCALFFTVAESRALVLGKEIIIFSQPCPSCETFKSFCETDLKREFPEICVKTIDLKDRKNIALLNKYIDFYDIRSKYIGTPLIFVGSHYLIGWSPDDKKRLYFYINEYLKEPMTRFPVSL